MTLEEIENAAGFVKNIDKLELPNQLVAVLADPLLQKMMLLRPSYESDQRIANWLNAVLQDVVSGDADENTLFELLDVLRDYVVSIKVHLLAYPLLFLMDCLLIIVPETASSCARLLCPLLTVLERRWPQCFPVRDSLLFSVTIIPR